MFHFRPPSPPVECPRGRERELLEDIVRRIDNLLEQQHRRSRIVASAKEAGMWYSRELGLSPNFWYQAEKLIPDELLGTDLDRLKQEAIAALRPFMLDDQTSRFGRILSQVKTIQLAGTFGQSLFQALSEFLESQLLRLKTVLSFALERLPARESKARDSKAGHARKVPGRLSRVDVDRCDRVGRSQIETLTNRELWARWRTKETKLRSGIEYQAFRLSLNRIRSYHRLPSSRDIQRKVTSIGQPN